VPRPRRPSTTYETILQSTYNLSNIIYHFYSGGDERQGERSRPGLHGASMICQRQPVPIMIATRQISDPIFLDFYPDAVPPLLSYCTPFPSVQYSTTNKRYWMAFQAIVPDLTGNASSYSIALNPLVMNSTVCMPSQLELGFQACKSCLGSSFDPLYVTSLSHSPRF
jgi:hypothetical protein